MLVLGSRNISQKLETNASFIGSGRRGAGLNLVEHNNSNSHFPDKIFDAKIGQIASSQFAIKYKIDHKMVIKRYCNDLILSHYQV